MTDTELIRAITGLAHDLSRRTTMWQYFFQQNTPDGMRIMLEADAQRRREGRATGLPDPSLVPPTTAEAVLAAEEAIGFRFPTLLSRLWTEVANGGFGPGYGLFGIEGGFADERQELTAVPLYLATIEDEGWAVALGEPWPERLVPICEWGCDHLSAIDCSTPEGEVVDLDGDSLQFRRKGMTFRQWMEAWVSGAELWD